jgi:heme exporter protein D
MKWSELFHMGGYAFYVWGSYLVTFVVIIAEVVAVIRRRKKLVTGRDAAKFTNNENQ